MLDMKDARRMVERMPIDGRAAWRAGERAAGALAAAPLVWIGLGALAAIAARGWLYGARSRRETVGTVMIDDVVTITPTATLREAAERMREANVGMLPVVAGGRLHGIITDRDIVVRAVARGADLATVRVSECATGDPVCAAPDWDVDEAMHVMADCQVGRLPVVDDGGRLVGVVTLSSLALRSAEDEEALQTAQAVSRRSARAA
jgi:CBS domain-containing protein